MKRNKRCCRFRESGSTANGMKPRVPPRLDIFRRVSGDKSVVELMDLGRQLLGSDSWWNIVKSVLARADCESIWKEKSSLSRY